MTTGVLLLAHGTPNSPDEMEAYLRNVMKRHPPTPEFVQEMKDRYATFGGRSPLLDITISQARGLEDRIGLPVRVGMKHWKPYIRDSVESSWSRVIGLPMSPFQSGTSAGYLQALEEAAGPRLVAIQSWHNEARFLDAWAERIDTKDPLLFTAHAVPARGTETYQSQIREAIRGILDRVGRVESDFAWQSRPNAPGEWTEPDVETVLKQKSWKSVCVVPVGFVTEHAEVLYDIDHLHRKTADELGMEYRRTEMLNASATLIEALEAVVRRVL